MRSVHSGNWQGLTGDVNYTGISINGKYRFPASNGTQPYLLYGISHNILLINKGSADISTGETGDATLSGSGFNLGAGLDECLDAQVSLTLGLMYRYVNYTKATGVNESGTIGSGLDGSGFSLLLSTAYHF